MVNHGRSKGCHTCRAKKVKCDETKPTCKRCTRVELECEGYLPKKPTKIIFKHHTLTVARCSPPVQKRHTRHAVRDLCKHEVVEGFRDLPQDEESLAFGFFLNSFVAPHQDSKSLRGFFDNISPAISTAHMYSPVYLAFSAVATQMYSQWCPRTLKPSGLPKVRLIQALERLQAALQDPIESKTQSTLMATLLLQFQDNVTSVQSLQTASRTHLNGALALAMHQGREGFDTPGSKYMLYRLINVEVSSAIREGRPVPEDLCDWWDSNEVPRSPSSDLDRIGIHVAGVQRTFAQTWRNHSRCKAISCPHLDLFSKLCMRATAAETDLIAWASDVPTHWTPFKFNLERLPKTRPPIQTYLGACDVYPSIQIASIWNSWRFYRLVALTTLLACVGISESTGLSGSSSSVAQIVDGSNIRVCIQNIVDSFCASVPFHVGNRERRCSLEDFNDPALDFPAYHCFLDDELGLPDRMNHTLVMPRDKHARHVIAQGAWHIINPLSRILSLCSGPAGASLTSAIREGQLSWIQGQLRRCVTLLGLDRDKLDPGDPLTARYRLLLSNNLSVTVGR